MTPNVTGTWRAPKALSARQESRRKDATFSVVVNGQGQGTEYCGPAEYVRSELSNASDLKVTSTLAGGKNRRTMELLALVPTNLSENSVELHYYS